MKTLQNDFTTPEQSKRLLELGVPADSADQVYYDDIMWGAHEFIPDDKTYSEIVAGHENISLPCWSVGRLIEIVRICDANKNNFMLRIQDTEDIIDKLIYLFEVSTKCGYMDFSKLEE